MDRTRREAYAQALRRAVRPGSTVLDIGTGPGIFALLACRYGARRVYAVESSDAIELARELAAANGFADRIEFIQARAEDVTLESRADVIISDLRGVLPYFGRNIPVVADAGRRHLAPGGTLVARFDTVLAALVECDSAHRRARSPWGEDELGLDLGPARRVSQNSPFRVALRDETLISTPVTCATLDYLADPSPDLHCEIDLVCARDAVAHGLCLWFDTTLAPDLGFSNAPGPDALVYGQLFLPWPEAVSVAAGDVARASIRARLLEGDYFWSWRSKVLPAGGSVPRAEFAQGDFYAQPISLEALRKRGCSR
jgi:protein arginine N-methyltransferase 1